MDRPVRVVDPPAFLQVIGHPLRWRLLVELAQSDRRVIELTSLTGHAQNTLSYHLAKLCSAGLVEARVSSADGRDTYYCADLTRIGTMLAGSARSLHPGLRLGHQPPWSPAEALAEPHARVLFVGTSDRARSRMAEALLVSRSGGRVVARAAGTHPAALHPLAVRVMREEYGIELDQGRSMFVERVLEESYDRVVTVCDRARQECPTFDDDPDPAHWSIEDPVSRSGRGELAAFRRVAAELDLRIGFLLAELIGGEVPRAI